MKCMPISMYMQSNEPHHKERAYMSKVVVTAKLSNVENLNTRDKCIAVIHQVSLPSM